MAFLAFSVDWGYITVTQSELQNAADSGALSGARALLDGREAAVAAAQLWAGKNVAAGQPVTIVTAEDVEIGRWNDQTASFTVLSANSATPPNAVRVTCHRTAARGNPLALFFAPVIGTTTADLTVTAIAKSERDICGLFVGIESVDVQNADVDSYRSSLGPYAAQPPQADGDICSDGAITLSPQGFVQGDARPGQGSSVSHPSQVTGSTEPRKHPISWEPVDTLGPSQSNNNSAIPSWALTDGGQRLIVEGTMTLNLAPGTYYLPLGMRIAGGASVVISGPTKFVLGGTVEVEGKGIVNLTTTPANCRLELVSSSAVIAGSAAMHADIYAPTTVVNVNGNAGFYGAIFARRIAMQGENARLHGDESLREKLDEYTTRTTLRQ